MTTTSKYNIIVTGYYKQKNLGDDLFEEIATHIFPNKIFKNIINRIEYVNIEHINSNNLFVCCDKLILFGGEVLNDYFLDRILEYKLRHPKTEYFAIGVSCNQEYKTIINKLNVFDKIVFRNIKDYEYFKDIYKENCLYAPDIVFLTDYHKKFKFTQQKNVGFFLAQPLYYNLNENDKYLYIRSLKLCIDYWLTKEYCIYFFPMCCNEKKSEDDIILINQILKKYTIQEKKSFRLFMSNKKIIEYLPKMKYTLCWRFHAVVLSMIYNIPFIALSNTPKILNILEDSNLNELKGTMENILDSCEYLVNNKEKIISKISKKYIEYNKLAKQIYLSNIYKDKRLTPPFYINKEDCDNIIKYIVKNYKKYCSSIDDDFNTELILFTLTRTVNTEYFYGLRSKINLGIDNLTNDILWLIHDLIGKSNRFFYYSITHIPEVYKYNKTLINSNKYCINMNYINQFDMDGLHRSGWSYVLNTLKDRDSVDGLICDFYLDRTFHWNCSIYSQLKVIPYVKPWIGFIHHTMDENYSDFNTTALFKNKQFLKSLIFCKGLVVLSNYMKLKVEEILKEKDLKITVYNLTHPTQFVDKLFTFNNFKNNNNKKIIQIGAWMRDISAIFKLELDEELNIDKVALVGKKMESYYNYIQNSTYSNNSSQEATQTQTMTPSISRDKKRRKTYINSTVNLIQYLKDNDYDELLSRNIVFLKLIDASAVNTLIECIVRNTPIVINKLPAVVEMLGEKYPLYYDDLIYAKNLISMKTIENAYEYLKKLDKTKLKISTFINEFDNILKEII